MTLIKSISGIRGTIGGKVGEGLSPLDIVRFSAAFGTWLIRRNSNKLALRIIVGRDARISGSMFVGLVNNTLVGLGFEIIDLGLATTPTVEMAVPAEKAVGGIILTASHNPWQWNALKLLNEKGEFINAIEGAEVLKIADTDDFSFATIDKIGKIVNDNTWLDKHIQQILDLPLVDTNAIKMASFKVAIDAVNSIGGPAIIALLKALGVKEIIPLYCEPTGIFPHNPEPLPEHLTEIASAVVKHGANLGFVVDPDVDRLAIVCEDGTMFGEEYTLVAVSDYILENIKGNTVSNLSSTRALMDVTEKYGGTYYASAVGEVNVVKQMKDCNAVIGGEGNGGIIYPELHYGRDALVGVALFLTHLAKKGLSCSALRKTYPAYFISKNKIELKPDTNVDAILMSVQELFRNEKLNTSDGVRIDFVQAKEWVHLRKSNTEPIIRIYAESSSAVSADNLAKRIMEVIQSMA